MHSTRLKSRFTFSLLCLFVFVFVAACEINGTASTSSQGNRFDTKPLGMGMTPELGTDGKPTVPPTGHYQSMVASNGVDFVGSDT